MSARRTIIATLIFIVLVTAYYLDGRRLVREFHAARVSARLVPMAPSEITGLEIERLGVKIVMTRGEEGWVIENPVRDRADQETVESLVGLLASQNVSGAERTDEGRLRDYGLAEAPVRVLVRGRSGAESAFFVGNETPVRGHVFARRADDPAVFTLSTTLLEQLRTPLSDFRDRRLLAIDPDEAVRLTLTSEGVTFQLARRGDEWFFEKPVENEKADRERIESICREIHMTRAADFIDTDTLSVKQYGLSSPSITASIETAAGGEPARLNIGLRRLGDPPTYYASRGGSDQVFTVPQTLVDSVRPTMEDLRSKRIISMEMKDVARVDLSVGGEKLSLVVADDGFWEFPGAPTDLVDQTEVQTMVERLLGLRVEEFFVVQPLLERSGLDQPVIRIEVTDHSGTRREGVETGKMQTGGRFVYARRIDSDEIFGTDPDAPTWFFKLRDHLRDKTMFRFDAAAVTGVRIVQGRAELNYGKRESGWVAWLVGAEDRTFQVRGNDIDRLMLAALALKWKDRLEEGDDEDERRIAIHELRTTERVIEFLDADNKPVMTIYQGGADDMNVYVRRGDGAFFAIDKKVYHPFTLGLVGILPQ